jgi:hypothetical protein
MLVRDFASTYRTKTDGELLHLLDHADQMSPEALAALRGELASRRIELSKSSFSEPTTETVPATPIVIASRTAVGVRSFLEQILIVYRSQFWTFFQLASVGAVVGYTVFPMRRYAVRQIVSPIVGTARIPYGETQLELLLLNLATIFLIWAATFFVFATICSAVEQTRSGASPSVRQCALSVLRRPLACFSVSLLLFLILLLAMLFMGAVSGAVWWALLKMHVRLASFALIIADSLATFAALLPFSRLVLAIPAVVLDGIRPGRAIFLSDELTEGKWLILALLLGKYSVAGYVAAMLPFWIRFWLWDYVHLPEWVAVAASWAAVTAVEPTLFIGLALLYLEAKNAAATTHPAYVQA